LNRVRDERHKFRDHDYIETEDGWLFGVVSDTHPPDRVLAYLKYMPGAGLWSRSGMSYRRVLTTYSLPEVAKVLELVKAIKPGYVFNDPMTGEEFTYVPVADVRRHYMCEERLERLLQGPRNGVERGCAMLVTSPSTAGRTSGKPSKHQRTSKHPSQSSRQENSSPKTTSQNTP
jgi:predicted nucleotidyltransferase